MKYTIEEIESMRDLKLKFHEDYGDDFTVEWEIITDLVEELKAIGEIVLKLNFSIAKEAYFKQEILDRTLLQRDKRLTEENKRLREALEIYADENNWGGDLSERRANKEISIDYWWDHCIADYDDYGNITHSDDGRIAREALEGK